MRRPPLSCLHYTGLIFVALFIVLWILAVTQLNNHVFYSEPSIFIRGFSNLEQNSPHSNKSNSYCYLDWDTLKLQTISVFNSPPLHSIEKENSREVVDGGWRPKTCTSFQKVAIIIPYRDRWFHLRVLLKRLHPMLRRQNIYYRVFVIEQISGKVFNRGMLKNIGVREALMRDNFDCFIFHDVDLVPEHDRNIYLCDNHIRHLASAIDEMRYHPIYENYAGGVVGLSRENIFKINGYSNIYYGWGNEDDDLTARAFAGGLKLSRPPEYNGRYKMVRHKKDDRSNVGYDLFSKWRARQFKDGLTSLPQAYRVVKVENTRLYVNITVDPKQFPIPQEFKNAKSEGLIWYLRFYSIIPGFPE